MHSKVLSAHVEFHHQPFLKPLLLSTGSIEEITEARVTVIVRAASGAGGGEREAIGRGSIYLSDLWAWPEPSFSHQERDRVMRALTEQIAAHLPHLCGDEAAHPLELGMRLHAAVCHGQTADAQVPILARAMCASPFDAAIHDATGHALQQSALDFYEEPAPLPSVEKYFGGHATAAIRTTLTAPRRELDAWIIVGAHDSLREDVAPWITQRGYRCFKLKLLARDNAEDAARTVEVFRGVRELGVQQPRLCVDTNEKNPDAASVLDYLQRLREIDEEAFSALEYLEQPTGRDITQHIFDWREVTQLKPVLLDEGLTSLDLLDEAVAQGWSGFALKTCKGHSFMLAAAAWAHQHDLLLTLQDLTNPGYSAIHAAICASRLPTVNGIELNSPQYTPAANGPWLPRMAGLFDPHGGVHRLPPTMPVGLGTSL